MFDQYIVNENSLKNVVKDDKVVGYQFNTRIANYRGAYLSLHNGYYIKMDGEVMPREKQKIKVNGKPFRSFEETKKQVNEFWNFDDEAVIFVEKEGGLEEGNHELELQQSVLEQYGYMPWDEEWVKNPPVPGSGAGAGKTLNICKFNLPLKGEIDYDEV